MDDMLFTPIQIGPREAPNRIIFGSHTTNFARRNLLSEQHADYYAARAQGGAGMIVLEEHIVHASDFPYANALLGFQPETPSAIASVARRVHDHGALAIVQLNHNGQQSVSDLHQHEVWAPSAVPDVATREVPKAMELADIRAVIDGFALTAQHARQGKADGVELQIADRSLLRQFLSPLTNQRGDHYGGALENRLRFIQETIEAVATALGADRVLGLRFCADELAPWGGITPEQGVEIARLLAATGRIHYLTVTMGSIYSTHLFPFHASMHTLPGYAAHLAGAVKAAINIPVFAAGRIMTARQAEVTLSEGQANGVEMIRTLIADPQLPKLSKEGQAKEARPCIACNQGCQVRTVMNVALGCAVNPDVLHAQSTMLDGQTRPEQTRTLLIVGGGPAGLEAARTAARRGWRVVLHEREQALGGAVRLAARGSGRGELLAIIDYLQTQIEQLGVEIRLGRAVTAEMVRGQLPDAVLVATGASSRHGLLPISGYEEAQVLDVRRILRGEPVNGQRVVIIDETASHGVMSVAELLATRGHTVEVVTEDFYVGRDLVATHDIVPWMQRTMALGLIMTPRTTVVRIEPGQVIVRDRFAAGERAISADTVVLGTYDRPAQDLYYALKGHVPRLFRAGDCVAPRRIEHAIAEGRHIGETV